MWILLIVSQPTWRPRNLPLLTHTHHHRALASCLGDGSYKPILGIGSYKLIPHSKGAWFCIADKTTAHESDSYWHTHPPYHYLPQDKSPSVLTAHYPPYCWAFSSHFPNDLIVILIGIQPAITVEVILVLGQSVHQGHLETSPGVSKWVYYRYSSMPWGSCSASSSQGGWGRPPREDSCGRWSARLIFIPLVPQRPTVAWQPDDWDTRQVSWNLSIFLAYFGSPVLIRNSMHHVSNFRSHCNPSPSTLPTDKGKLIRQGH